MDVAYPIRAMVPTLDGPVLAVLAGTTGSLTSPEIRRIAGVGSVNGVRKVLARLVREGLVIADEQASATFYRANREHLAWTAVEVLVSMRRTLLARLEQEFTDWRPGPIHASIFGSMARGDGDSESDIDMLLIRPDDVDEDTSPWAELVDALRLKVRMWTGNRCQVFQIDMKRLAAYQKARDPLIDEWLRNSVVLTGPTVAALLRESTPGTER